MGHRNEHPLWYSGIHHKIRNSINQISNRNSTIWRHNPNSTKKDYANPKQELYLIRASGPMRKHNQDQACTVKGRYQWRNNPSHEISLFGERHDPARPGIQEPNINKLKLTPLRAFIQQGKDWMTLKGEVQPCQTYLHKFLTGPCYSESPSNINPKPIFKIFAITYDTLNSDHK